MHIDIDVQSVIVDKLLCIAAIICVFRLHNGMHQVYSAIKDAT